MNGNTKLSVKIRREGFDGIMSVERIVTVDDLKRDMMATHSDSTCSDILAEVERNGIAHAAKSFMATITIRKAEAGK